MKKFISILVVLIMLTGTVYGCKRDKGEKVDDSKTQLYINTYFAGLGEEWLLNYKREFEEFYSEYSFQPGKMGVQIFIDYDYTGGQSSIRSVVNSRAEVIWSESIDYYDTVSSKLAYDITDITTDKLTEYGENRSIADKLDAEMLDYLKSYDNKIYALPFYDGYKGITYDIDIFEDYGFYFDANGNFTTGLEGANPKSKGPDDIENTYDDGLPRTYEQFFKMTDRMVQDQVVPFIWTGAYNYADMLTKALWVNFEGKEQINLNFSFLGTAKDLISVDSNGVVTKRGDVEITPENGYEMFSQEGRYRALEFAKRLVSKSSYYSNFAFSGSQSHAQAQENYLYGSADSSLETIAMLVDGAWWQEEARGIFLDMASTYEPSEDYLRENRRFAFMPLPHYDESKVGQKNTVMSLNYSYVFINNKIAPDKVEVAKKFLEFTSSDRMLQNFNETIYVTRPFNYTLDDDTLDNMPDFAKSLYNIRFNSDVVYPFSGNKFWLSTGLNYENTAYYHATWGGKSFSFPIYAFKENIALTPKAYFDSIYSYYKTLWPTYVNAYNNL